MNAAQAKELIGKYGIFQIGDNVSDNRVEAISPSGKFVQLRYQGWQSIVKVSFIEELPAPDPAPTATATQIGEATEGESALQAELAAAADAARQLQEQNTILNEQLGQAKREIIALKQALTEDKPILAAAPTDGGRPGDRPPATELSFPTGG